MKWQEESDSTPATQNQNNSLRIFRIRQALEQSATLFPTYTKHGELIKDLFPAKWPRWIMNPASVQKQTWDTWVLLLVFVSGFMIPLDVAFYGTSALCDDRHYQTLLECKKTLIWKAISFMVDFLFWCDLLLGFRTAYMPAHVRERAIIACPKACAWNYLTTWFVLDLMGTIPFEDYAMVDEAAKDRAEDQAGMRVLKLLKLPRLFRTGRLFKKLDDLSPFFRIVSLLAVVTLFTHWVASAWFLLGTYQYVSS
ncbi:hypothetical protein CYMTET_23242, partial [Cymbomonas tetramitiformis]